MGKEGRGGAIFVTNTGKLRLSVPPSVYLFGKQDAIDCTRPNGVRACHPVCSIPTVDESMMFVSGEGGHV